MAETTNANMKKLADLRVVDLRAQLEERGLEKTGVKAALMDRLKKAIQDDGKDPEEITFDVSEKKGAVTPTKKNPDKETSDDIEEDIEEEEEKATPMEVNETEKNVPVTKEDVMENKEEKETLKEVEAPQADEEIMAVNKEVSEDKPAAESSIKENGTVETPAAVAVKDGEEEMETQDTVMADAKVLDEITDEDAINISIEDEDKLLAEEEEEETPEETAALAIETKVTDEADKTKEVNGAQEGESAEKVELLSGESNKENNEKASDCNTPQKKPDNPPSPTSVPVPQPSFTAEDTLKLHNTSDRKDDDISLIVHVDDTQNDLDNDLLKTPLGKMATGEEDGEAKKVAPDKETGSTTSPANPAGLEVQKTDADSKSSSTSPKKSSTDPKKSPSDSKKLDGGKKEDSSKKTGDKESDKKEGDKSKSDSKTSTSKSSSAKDDKGHSRSSSGGSSVNSRNLWVSGLSSATRATDLKTLFSKHGKVAGAKVVTNPRSPGSRCYGFVTMSSTEEASKCIQHLHRTELHGRMISVERAKNEPSVHPPSHRRSESSKSESDRRDSKRDDKKDKDKRDTKHSDRKDSKSTDKKDEKKNDKKDEKKPEKKEEEKKTDKKEEEKKEGEADKKEVEKKEGDKVAEKKDEKKEGDKKDETKPEVAKKDGEKKDDRRRSSSSRRHSGGDRHPDKRSESVDNRSNKSDKKDDVLSFQKIKAERERERLRQTERRIREEERWRTRDWERERQKQREIAREQREESARLERERNKIRLEREKLERERLEVERAERERRLEREKREREQRIEREREETRRLEQLRQEQERRASKRPYDRNTSRDDQYWSTEPKRAAMSDRIYDRSNQSGSYGGRGYGDYGDHRSTGGSSRGTYEDSLDRRVERYDRKDARSLDSNSRHADPRYDDRRDDQVNRSSREPPTSRDVAAPRDRDDRRFEDRRSGPSDRGFESKSNYTRYDDRGLAGREADRQDRRLHLSAPDRRETDRHDRLTSPGRRGQESRSMPSNSRDSHRDRSNYDSIVKGGSASNRDQWGIDSRKDSSWPSGSVDSSRIVGQSDRWGMSSSSDRGVSSLRGAHPSSMVLNSPLLQTPPTNQNFLASAANIMMGVGMASSRAPADDRYNAYKNISGTGRRY